MKTQRIATVPRNLTARTSEVVSYVYTRCRHIDISDTWALHSAIDSALDELTNMGFMYDYPQARLAARRRMIK